ncbi:MAG: hypothetical protein RJA49_2478 [Actinomycetota bacterium]
MIRRTLLAAALVGVAALSSCSTSASSNNTVAKADGQELTQTQLTSLTAGDNNGDAARKTIGQWLQVAAVGGDLSAVVSISDLQKAGQKAATEMAAPFLPGAGDLYAKGLDGSPTVCLGAIPVAATTDPQEVIDAMTAGMTLADAATKYSADPAQATSGGIVADANGNTCLPTPLNTDITDQMTKAGAVPGKPVVLQLASSKAIVVIRPFEDLSQQEQVSIVQNDVAKEFSKRLTAAEVYVNPRYGRWDAATGTVVPLDQG